MLDLALCEIELLVNGGTFARFLEQVVLMDATSAITDF